MHTKTWINTLKRWPTMRKPLLSYNRMAESVELSQSYGWIGKILFDVGENERAMAFFNRSLAVARQTRSREDEARVLAYFGFLHASSGDYDLGAEFYEDSLRIAQSLGNIEFTIAAHDSLAWIYDQAGDDVRALDSSASWRSPRSRLIARLRSTALAASTGRPVSPSATPMLSRMIA